MISEKLQVSLYNQEAHRVINTVYVQLSIDTE
jgi:hypothetical protein